MLHTHIHTHVGPRPRSSASCLSGWTVTDTTLNKYGTISALTKSGSRYTCVCDIISCISLEMFHNLKRSFKRKWIINTIKTEKCHYIPTRQCFLPKSEPSLVLTSSSFPLWQQKYLQMFWEVLASQEIFFLDKRQIKEERKRDWPSHFIS